MGIGLQGGESGPVLAARVDLCFQDHIPKKKQSTGFTSAEPWQDLKSSQENLSSNLEGSGEMAICLRALLNWIGWSHQSGGPGSEQDKRVTVGGSVG